MKFAPVTSVLVKTFAAGFYRVHAGLLLTLFATLFINFFFTNVLNQTHLNQEEILLNNLKLVLTSVSNPVAMGVLFLIWAGYTVKSCQYVLAQVVLNQNCFLFYSITALSLQKQFQTWMIVQAVISLPIIALGVFAAGVGMLFGHLYIPFVIPLYLMFLIAGSTFCYVRFMNDLAEKNDKTYVLNWLKTLPKPLFSLFLYQIVYRYKLHYVVTKAISIVIMIGMFVLFRDHPNDVRVAGVSMMGVIIAHTILIFQSNEFDRFYLDFTRNFPTTQNRIYLQLIIHYFLLLLPEIILLFYLHSPDTSLIVSISGLSSALLFRSILYGQNRKIGDYLKIVFVLFILSSLSMIFGAILWLAVINLAVSYFLFRRNY